MTSDRRRSGRQPGVALSFAVAGCMLAAAAPTALSAQVHHQDLYESGRSYGSFYETALGRRSLWIRNTENATVSAELRDRAERAVAGSPGGVVRLLVVALDRCSDSVSTIPYMAALADAVPGLELRVVDPEAGQAVLESHPTPDGRAATPTVLLLDRDHVEIGAWVERPAALQEWYLDRQGKLDANELYAGKMRWYDEDAGRSTLEEIVALIERAHPSG